MSESILKQLRALLGVEEETTAFDLDIITAANAALMTLNQLGVGPAGGVFIVDESTTWADVLGCRTDLGALQEYILIKTRLLFDTSLSSAVQNALVESASEFEWRLSVQNEND